MCFLDSRGARGWRRPPGAAPAAPTLVVGARAGGVGRRPVPPEVAAPTRRCHRRDHASGLPRGHFGAKEAQRTRCGVRNDAAFEFQRSKSVDFCRPKANPCVSLWRTLGGFGTKSQFWNTASNLESTIDPAFSRKKEIYYLYNLPFSKGQYQGHESIVLRNQCFSGKLFLIPN